MKKSKPSLKKAKQFPFEYEQGFKAGLSHYTNGDLDAAITIFEGLAKRFPTIPTGIHNLGYLLTERGEAKAAIPYLQQAIKLAPQYVDAYLNLGRAYLLIDKYAAAEAAYRGAQQLEKSARTYNALGSALAQTGKSEQAIKAFRTALEFDNKFSDAWRNLAKIYSETHQFAAVPAIMEKLLQLEPQSHHDWNGLGVVNRRLNRFEAAITAYRKAVELAPEQIDYQVNLGEALDADGDVATAELVYRKVIELKPDFAPVYSNLGRVLGSLGKSEQQLAAYRKALALNPMFAKAWRNLILAKRCTAEDQADRDAMEELLQHAELSAEDRLELHFGLGKFCDDIKDYHAAFDHYVEGNKLAAQQNPYDRSATELAFDSLRKAYTAELVNRFAQFGHPSETPIFVLGMPRSGTTLVEQIIASHPQASGAGELRQLGEVAQQFEQIINSSGQYQVTQQQLSTLAKSYLDQLGKNTPNAQRISDKMPFNFYHAALIRIIFPNARIIHCTRNPIDTCLSNFFLYFPEGATYSNDLYDLKHYYQLYQSLIAHYRDTIGIDMLEVHYRDTVENFEAVARDIIAYIDLPWSDACLGYHRSNYAVRTASAWQVRQPIYSSSVERWRNYETQLAPYALHELTTAS